MGGAMPHTIQALREQPNAQDFLALEEVSHKGALPASDGAFIISMCLCGTCACEAQHRWCTRTMS